MTSGWQWSLRCTNMVIIFSNVKMMLACSTTVSNSSIYPVPELKVLKSSWAFQHLESNNVNDVPIGTMCHQCALLEEWRSRLNPFPFKFPRQKYVHPLNNWSIHWSLWWVKKVPDGHLFASKTFMLFPRALPCCVSIPVPTLHICYILILITCSPSLLK